MIPPPISTKRILKRLAPLSCGKILGALYFTLGLLFLPIFLFFAVMAPAMPPGQRMPFMAVGGIFMIFMPVIYGVLGFIFGALGAFLYNLFSRWVGGIEMEFE